MSDFPDMYHKSFYNWLLLNGVDVFVKGSEMSKSSLGSTIMGEIDMKKLHDAIDWQIEKTIIEKAAQPKATDSTERSNQDD